MKILTYIIMTLLTLAFLFFGNMKLLAQPGLIEVLDPKGLPLSMLVETFDRFGLPQFTMYIIGGFEVICAVGLWVRRVSPVAAYALTVVMVGAAVFHLIHDPITAVIMPIVLGALTAFVGWQRHQQLKEYDAALSRIS